MTTSIMNTHTLLYNQRQSVLNYEDFHVPICTLFNLFKAPRCKHTLSKARQDNTCGASFALLKVTGKNTANSAKHFWRLKFRDYFFSFSIHIHELILLRTRNCCEHEPSCSQPLYSFFSLILVVSKQGLRLFQNFNNFGPLFSWIRTLCGVI